MVAAGKRPARGVVGVRSAPAGLAGEGAGELGWGDLRRPLRCDRIDAPCLFDGPVNGEAFLAYVRTFLVPTLRPGDIVVLDNLGSHRGRQVRRAIRKAGARLVFLPKYSPDLNPIEQVFAKLKHHMRQLPQELRLFYLKPTRSGCLVPGFDGALFSGEWKDALWARFFMGAPRRQRRSVERYNIVKRA